MTPRAAHRDKSVRVSHILGRFIFVLIIFVAVNLAVAQWMSDCGLPALLGLDRCSDDIVRLGWPFRFYEQGGIAFHSFFSGPRLIGDLAAGVVGAILITVGSLRLHRPR